MLHCTMGAPYVAVVLFDSVDPRMPFEPFRVQSPRLSLGCWNPPLKGSAVFVSREASN